MKYVKIDENGFIKAFYSEDIHGNRLIEDINNKIEITEEEYNNQEKGFVYKSSKKITKKGEEKIIYYKIPLIKNLECKIPNNVIEISDELWKEHIKGKTKIYKDGKWQDYVEPEEIKFQRTKTKILNAINDLANQKSRNFKNLIMGKKVTQEQLERYEAKYRVALKCKENEDYTAFIAEASSEENAKMLVNEIIKKHEEWLVTLDKYAILIEAFRVKATKLVEQMETFDKLELAKQLLNKAKQFGINTTEEDIIKLFEEFEKRIRNR